MLTKDVHILIADDEINQYLKVKKILESQENIKVIGVAKDGIKACNMILELSPDIAIIDGIMPKLDGLGILEKLNLNNSKTKCIIISPLSSERVIKKSLELGAEYYMLKPFDIHSLIERINEIKSDIQENLLIKNYANSNKINFSKSYNLKKDDISNKFLNNNENYTKGSLFYNKKDDKDDDIKDIKKDDYIKQKFFDDKNTIISVTEILHNLGIPANIRGYHYIRDAIILSVNNLELLNYVTKELYPAIAKKNNTTSCKVERAIRHAIEVAWVRGNHSKIEELFGYSINKTKGKPTNSEFIALIVDTIILNKSKISEMCYI